MVEHVRIAENLINKPTPERGAKEKEMNWREEEQESREQRVARLQQEYGPEDLYWDINGELRIKHKFQ